MWRDAFSSAGTANCTLMDADGDLAVQLKMSSKEVKACVAIRGEYDAAAKLATQALRSKSGIVAFLVAGGVRRTTDAEREPTQTSCWMRRLAAPHQVPCHLHPPLNPPPSQSRILPPPLPHHLPMIRLQASLQPQLPSRWPRLPPPPRSYLLPRARPTATTPPPPPPRQSLAPRPQTRQPHATHLYALMAAAARTPPAAPTGEPLRGHASDWLQTRRNRGHA